MCYIGRTSQKATRGVKTKEKRQMAGHHFESGGCLIFAL